ncbi:hypothetical protein H8959_019919 [Pygathrix nigripes]
MHKIQWDPTSLQDITAVLGTEAYTEEDKSIVSHAQKSQHSWLSHSSCKEVVAWGVICATCTFWGWGPSTPPEDLS